MGKVCGRVYIVQIVCTPVSKWKTVDTIPGFRVKGQTVV
jgi:hypothetical protein